MAERQRPWGAALTSLLAALALTGCASSPVASPSPSPSVAAVASATDEELHWIAWRVDAGLRADLEYVRSVAADPSARMDFSIPLLPFEISELNARMANADEVRELILHEAELAPNSYCGMYIDHHNGGTLTSMWKVNLEGHAAAIRKQVRPGARVAFVGCRFTKAQLDAAMDAMETFDFSWMKAVPAALQGVGVSTQSNRLEMQISSAVPDAAEIVRAHVEQRLGLPAGLLTVASDGTGAALVPWGAVDVTLVGPNGILTEQNIERAQLTPGWASPISGLACGHGDVGVGFTNLPCQAGHWTITVQAPVADGEWTTIGQGTVDVAANRTSKLTIRLPRVPQPGS
jgi:hypothetical protein